MACRVGGGSNNGSHMAQSKQLNQDYDKVKDWRIVSFICYFSPYFFKLVFDCFSNQTKNFLLSSLLLIISEFVDKLVQTPTVKCETGSQLVDVRYIMISKIAL